ncbi:ATP-dependent RNA helicase DDX51 isoform X1 [Varanus komodoensis]|uniref:ATP-dependent RNA helicase DDX51 isoform X1 n=1 Tax=Varanus komodoensis TaxID=61221 RepID=UPI001CF7BF49|nr:ATP-dependent RNA helicase DDX51 isoform X1 [Varanus komodoensis]
MALFLVRRYISEEEDEQEEKSQELLHQLQERARARELQKQQDVLVSSEQRGLENEISGLDSEQKSEKKKTSEVSFFEISPRKRNRRLHVDEKKSLDEANGGFGSSRRKKNGKDSQVAQGRIEATEGNASQLVSFLESRGTGAGERKDDLGSKRSQGREKQMMLAPNPEEGKPPASSMAFLGHCAQKTVQKGPSLLPQWLAQPRLVQRQIKENLTSFEEVPLIHPKLVKKMQANGIESLFPVQAEVIPVILESVSNGFLAGRGGYRPSDICVSAPTGSGKTLAFVIPVVQALLDRVVCQVRALAVLPTKELAQQVSKVFNVYTDGLGLKVVQLTGQKSFAKEQESLVERTLTGFRSLADIVVATPGRLVDHLQQSPQFSLRELRFLIIDEADRIIDSMQQDWLQQVTKAACHSEEEMGPIRLFRQVGHGLPITAARSCCPYLPLQKLLFSATLTWNPEKLQQLGLYQPCLFMPVSSEKQAEVQQEPEKKYTIPEGLSQYYVPCSLSWKPLFLLHFLLRLKFSRVLCFTNSKDTSHRLFLLIRAFGGVNVAEFSSRLSPSQRKRTLKEFEQGKIQLLISTDATARGIDIVGVKCVISYDAPQFIRTYIHRVGRTARAGKAGLAFTMLLKQQERKFLKMLRDAGLPKLEQQLVKSKFIQPLLQPYQEALAELQQIVKEEQAEKRS